MLFAKSLIIAIILSHIFVLIILQHFPIVFGLKLRSRRSLVWQSEAADEAAFSRWAIRENAASSAVNQSAVNRQQRIVRFTETNACLMIV
jgi:hypothetical protein